MSSELSRTELSCLITHKKGFAFKSKDYIPSGVPVVRVSNFTWDSISTDDLRYVSHEVASSTKVVQLNEYDVIVATVGSWPQNPDSIVGKVVRVPCSLSGALLNQNTVRLRVNDDNLVNQKYLYIALKTKEFSDHLISKAQGSANQASITLSDIFSYAIPWGTYTQRKSIVDVIDSINDKIVIANQINQTLEQMAQALFKSWFVDFEPVKAKIAVLEAGGSQADATLAAMTAISGKGADALAVFEREQPEQYAELKATAELFPSAMQESDQGCIPEGWEYRKIGDYIDNISKTYPLKKVEQVVFLNTGDIKEGVFLHRNKSDVGSLPGQAKKSIKEGDILYSEIRPVNKRFAFVCFNADEYVVSTKLMVLRPKSKELSHYLYFLLSSNEVVSYLQLMAESRSGTFPQITYDTVSDIKILTSSDESVIKSFCKFLGENLYNPQQSIIKQNDILTNIRDTLLPKLLSGEITLPEAEQAVSEAENV